MEFKNAILLTGGIATGKSSVCNFLKLHGFSIIDADKIAHEVLDENASKISEMFGDEYVKDGRVDRRKLGELVFSDKDKKSSLEALLHPLIEDKIKKEALKLEKFNVPYIVDIPLFFETGKRYDIKPVVVVYAPKELQIERLVKREGYDLSHAKSRVESQIDIEKKRQEADFVIDNSKDIKHLQKEVDRFLDFIRGRYADLKI
ncbi:MAG: dephospho-CoA kinase [Epsilonproteobacteria bacterium]|nr:dephospho-CoA kinase [Campylobacterota bacterium]